MDKGRQPMSRPPMTDAKRIAAEWACERLIRRFALLNDAGEYEELASLFVEDGSFARPTDPDNPVVGRQAILGFFRSRPKRTTRHLMSNIVVDVEDDGGTARAVSYVTLYSGPAGSGTPPIAADPVQLVGAYHDKLVLTDAGWRFAERRGSVALKTRQAQE
ncbi:MAG TPA: nuclear transport factor 2 family protein [Stellaceae bacterium]|jgi:hypothetical protein